MMPTDPSTPLPQPRKIKLGFHEKNALGFEYDLVGLTQSHPPLAPYIQQVRGENTIVYSNRQAVIELNRAILKFYFQIHEWFLPPHALCPPIPSRWDYLLRLRDLLPNKTPLRGLDIGTGSNLIYSLLAIYGLQSHMVATDISADSLAHAAKIKDANDLSDTHLDLRLQEIPHQIFNGVVRSGERFDFCVCNPPFHASEKEAIRASSRKLRNLGLEASTQTLSNFGGVSNELWCKGGEAGFLKKMLKESVRYGEQITWFSSLVSKSETLPEMIKFLNKHGATEVKVLPLEHGNKKSRAVAWTFQT